MLRDTCHPIIYGNCTNPITVSLCFVSILLLSVLGDNSVGPSSKSQKRDRTALSSKMHKCDTADITASELLP